MNRTMSQSRILHKDGKDYDEDDQMCSVSGDKDRFRDGNYRDRTHRCQPSRNLAGNPAFWLISRIFARTSRISCFISK